MQYVVEGGMPEKILCVIRRNKQARKILASWRAAGVVLL